MFFWYGNDTNVWGYALMAVSMVLFWGLVIYWVLALVRYPSREDRLAVPDRPTPEQVLAERLARGEIDEREYHQVMDTLRGVSRPLTKS